MNNSIISFSAFFHSLDLFSLSLLPDFFKNDTESKIFGHHQESNPERLCVKQVVLGSVPGGNQIFLILYHFFLKPCERERIHLMNK